MKSTTVIVTTAAAAVISLGAALIAQNPGENVNPYRHPNIAAAQMHVEQAISKVDAAQQANEWDMNGHAQKAKDLLMQADRELKAAAMTANRR